MNQSIPSTHQRSFSKARGLALAIGAGLFTGWAARSVTRTTKDSPPPVLSRSSPTRSAAKTGVSSAKQPLTLSESGLISNLKSLREWAAREPDEALAWLTEHAAVALATQRESVLSGLLIAGRADEARELIESMSDSSLRHGCREAMYLVMAESDPAEAFNYATQHTLFRSSEAVRSLFVQWAARDPETASKAWSLLPHAAQRTEALVSVALAMGQANPEAAFSWANSLTDAAQRNVAVELAWAGWARKDPNEVLAASQKLEPSLRRAVAQNAMVELARKDPEAARSIALEEKEPALRDAMLFSIGQELTQRAPELAAKLSEELSVGTEESTLTVGTMRAWLHADPEQAIGWAAALPANRRGDALHAAFYQLADADPRTAAEMLSRSEMPAGLNEQAQLVGRGFAEQDPEAATKWADSQPESRKLDALRGVLTGAARENPEKALEILSRQPASLRGDLVESIASGWAHRDPEQALEWTKSLAGGDRTRASAKVIELLASVAPEKAASAVSEWVIASNGEPPSGMEAGYTNPAVVAIGQVARHWDPERMDEAIAWSSSLPAGEVRDQAVTTLFQEWAKSSSVNLANHLQSMPPGADRDEGSYQLALTMARADMGVATAWAASLSHPDARSSAARFFMEAARDKAQAFHHITSSGLLTAEETHAIFKTP